MKTKPTTQWLLVIGMVLLTCSVASVNAQGTAFTYQGRLDQGAAPYSGSAEFQATLWNAPSGGTALASNSPVQAVVSVTNGLFVLPLTFGSNFPGADRWLQLEVRTSLGAFNILSPRQPLTPIPYAITAGNLAGSLPATQLSGTIPSAQLPLGIVTNNATGLTLTGNFTGSGANLTSVDAATLGGISSAGLWKTNGNAGANPTNGAFLGTPDNLPLEFKVNGLRALRLEPNANGAPNVVGGAPGNFVGTGASGAVIGGGGAANFFGAHYTNSVAGNFGSVGGGAANTVLSNAHFSTIGGGYFNSIQAFAQDATIGGGEQNVIQANGIDATIGGGAQNLIQLGAFGATISGGTANTNQVNAYYASIGGGYYNTIQSNGAYATIAGGRANLIETNAIESTISGGSANTIQTGVQQATIGGGNGNTIQGYNYYATIGGGYNNTVFPGADSSTINGGNGNNISAAAAGATIGGGLNNLIENGGFGFGNNFTTIGGGYGNMIQSSAQSSTIAGGWGNRIAFGGEYSAIGGGTLNTNTGEFATIPGGSANVAANFSFAAGHKAKAVHDSTFVWADGQGVDFSSTAVNQFLVRASGGMGINTNNPAGAALAVVGGIRTGVNGTVQSRVQFGTATVGTGAIGVNTFTITFPTAFTLAPKVFVMVKGNDNPDTFAISTRAVTAANFKVNIVRIDVASGWGQLLQVDWYAVE